MRRITWRYLMIVALMLALAACTAPRATAPAPTAASAESTATTAPSATPTGTRTPTPAMAPSATPTATATPSPTATLASTPGCLAQVTPPAVTPDPRPLRVAYLADSRLWLWREETGQTGELAGGLELQGCFLSPDRKLVAFTRAADAEHDEIWVAAMDGTGERRVATVGKQEARERHPGMYLTLYMGWVPNTHMLWYCRGYGGDFTMRYDAAVWVVDADGGAPRLLVPLGDTWALAFSPTGQQLAVLGETELRLIDVATGQVAHTVAPTAYREDVRYSPDGGQVLVYTGRGLTFVDAATGARRDIALPYEALGVSNHSIFPIVRWQGDGATALVVVFNVESFVQLMDPAATFTLWRLDLQEGIATKLQTFTGGAFSYVELSPDSRRVAYSRYVGGNVWEVYLSDLESGKTVWYGQGTTLKAPCWSSDSQHFVLTGQYLPMRVGHLCAPPTLAGPSVAETLNNVGWVYAIEGRDGFLAVGRAPDGTSHLQIVLPDGTVRPVATRSAGGSVLYVGHWLGE